ncbi:Uncharacterised protein [[Clostridium] sordellii]|uniref:hypothetical protein n=1 Tax=Paraclostridium sordellii TaxID=1505 RepID=UPI0005EA29E9|nr:hypothetical protein [Paeniclostridium sordellii]CEQ01619.1 Uncharacterised protein [[Clostridium] sordellii] [Paeniclostridium sordellii]
MYNIEKLITCMENKFEVRDEDDLVFKELFYKIKECDELVEDCKKRFIINYEEMYYYAIGVFSIDIIDINNNKIKTYEIALRYDLPLISDGDEEAPELPMIEVRTGKNNTDIIWSYK